MCGLERFNIVKLSVSPYLSTEVMQWQSKYQQVSFVCLGFFWLIFKNKLMGKSLKFIWKCKDLIQGHTEEKAKK